VRDALRRLTLERGIQLALVAVVVTAVLAGGAILEWIPVARKVRWAALFVLAALAGLYALRRRRQGRLDRGLAPAAALISVALASTLWSATPRLTVARAGALTIVLASAAALAFASAGEAERIELVLEGLLLAAVAVAVGGLLVLAFRYDRAVQPATTISSARYQGLGGGPNMATMILALATPLAAHTMLTRKSAARVVGAAAFALLIASIAFSGSRGALAASSAGLFAYALLGQPTARSRIAFAAGAAAVLALSLAVAAVPSTAAVNPPDPTGVDPNPVEVTPAPGYIDANRGGLRLQDDIGHPAVGEARESRVRGLLGSSGRTEAWNGALGQALERPIVGHGFGTEDRVFIDRYVGFNSNVPENSYLGFLLQLGFVGLVLVALLAALLAIRAVRAASFVDDRRRVAAAACAAVVVAGLVLAFVQSYLYAPGNNATAAFWICAFLFVSATANAAAERD
jgi:MFS family permease